MKQISILTAVDLPMAYQIEKRSHTFPWSEHIFTSSQGKLYFNIKLHIQKEMLGFAITQIVLDEATLFNLAVDPFYQRQGCGSFLMEYLIDYLRGFEVKNLWLEVRISNLNAIRLYEKFGFNEVSIKKEYYPKNNGREDALIMALPLLL
ncbi:ribosomal protein S18-alanine N-acetyltransferase [Candidatus Hamiltonella defensa]|uniref:[Ribosomal protein bS18]-alanine N-acetyltransferase n=2 Tax=Candidatus Williamhamiltonella defendens TaxID=138072 RepID=A0AAC9YGT5_9ENTR|nr:ribosomal protein S18-alanine N-acetyltransferase [Candidatus Hamiltonella defensa]ASV33748.1 ribosomal-protein-alanine N-acetyltransferase [Candidatus Hamiltonella defensa]AWK16704.1 ribosomal-protein-alanine N-acetyltransferase [Candidatus Hamiltonella defensa]MBK4360730.1 ribosomal protein S18-alanine N-acetyltransferase [Candidatus Hamiltonella defensa]